MSAAAAPFVALPFDDIMEIAIALLALSPAALGALGWSFADRKRLLDHFMASGKAAQRTDRTTLGETPGAPDISARCAQVADVRLPRFAQDSQQRRRARSAWRGSRCPF